MIKQQAPRRGPGNGNLDADIRRDPEYTGTITGIDNHIFVAAQRTELRRGVGLHGKTVENFAAASMQGIGIGMKVLEDVGVDVGFITTITIATAIGRTALGWRK